MTIKPPILIAAISFVLLPATTYGQLGFNELFRDADQDFKVNISTDQIHHVYEEGDQLSLEVSVSHNAYLHIFNVTPDGQIRQLVPTDPSNPVKLSAGVVHQFPQDYAIEVVPPFGAEQIWCLATDSQVDMSPGNANGKFGAFLDMMAANGGSEPQRPSQAALLKSFIVRQRTEQPTSNWSGQAINVITVPRCDGTQAGGDGVTESRNEGSTAPRRRVFVGICPDNSVDGIAAIEELASAYAEWGFSSKLLLRSQATKKAVTDLLQQLSKETSSGDVICIHFQGQYQSIPQDVKNARPGDDLQFVDGWLMSDSDADTPRSLLSEERLATAVSFLPNRYVLLTADMKAVHRGGDQKSLSPEDSSDGFEIANHLVEDSLRLFVSIMRTDTVSRRTVPDAIPTSIRNQQAEHAKSFSLPEVLAKTLRHEDCNSLLKVANALLNSNELRHSPAKWTATVNAQNELAGIHRSQD